MQKSKEFRVVSLFDGCAMAYASCLKAGLTPTMYDASEIDKYAIKMAEKNVPVYRQIGDVQMVSGYTYEFIGLDLLIGGSPCQDLSIAKAGRKGLDGARSGLFWEFVRVLKESKPRYFLLENVASMNEESKNIISEALGVQPIMINSALVSAQQRKRLYWTNIPGVKQPTDLGIRIRDILEGEVDDKYIVNPSERYGDKGLCSLDGKAKSMSATMWKGYGNDGVSTIRVGHYNSGGQGDRIYSIEGKSVGLSALGGGRGAKTGLYEVAPDIIRKLTPTECERLQTLPDGWTAVEGMSNTQRYKALGNGFTVNVIAHILSFIPKE